ncbi:MAG: transaldolase [Candidatus Magasanikbacteria bacterium CG_4_10_14_0_2_um_filter_37_12]|uniref:Transaldolase n=1 Tax=Candidatus Magasanikbacteria bacterium CG_4_10_14_0_2_um_filter_37_12 TaxID=1974637 RepID=A0A2M7V787_9BACT|nr:MAG: transaldolase [Candidatus Magasanikbacteria bacterium CG_4_10_14_0_2_um_filter_37_12]
MQRSANLKTKIFLDSGSAEHTKIILNKLGFLDGQTTNPTYFIKSNPEVKKMIEEGHKFTKEELLGKYKILANEISALVPNGSVSIEVYADKNSTAEDLLTQAHEMNQWIPNAHIKLPIIPAGLETAGKLIAEGIRVNMTLCFSQAQGAAVYMATRDAKPGQVFLSPFISRLDKIGQNGFDLLLNIQKMFHALESPVEILAASVHSVYDIAHVIEKGMDIITIPYDDVSPWVESGMPFSTSGLEPKDTSGLAEISYEDLDLSADWRSFDITHELTDVGLQQFADDWNGVLAG